MVQEGPNVPKIDKLLKLKASVGKSHRGFYIVIHNWYVRA